MNIVLFDAFDGVWVFFFGFLVLFGLEFLGGGICLFVLGVFVNTDLFFWCFKGVYWIWVEWSQYFW